MQTSRPDVGRLGFERLVPSVILPPEDPSGPRPRTVRDWLIDVGAMVGAAVVGAFSLYTVVDTATDAISTTWVTIDLVAGVVAVLALFVRRNRPMVVGLLTAVLTVVSVSAGTAALIAVFTVAVHRRFAFIAPVVVTNLVAANILWLIRPSDLAWWVENALTLGLFGIVVGYGMFVRARRQLVWTLQERAQRAEDEQELRTERARLAERARIAREMHDVLGHRISLFTLHAGGLEMRPDLPPEEIAEVAGLLRSTGRQALEDLRTVIGILREDGSVDLPNAPQPTLGDLQRLIDDNRRAGATVSLTSRVEADATAPEAVGRVAYRVVQEALTNVAKHAEGAATVVDVTGGPDTGLVVRVRNDVPIGSDHPSLPGSGVGLIGLRERVELAGGTLEHGVDGRGQFVVEARLLWV